MSNKTIHTKSISSLLGLMICILLAGCEKDVDNIKLPKTDPKLVVGCFISPQDNYISVTLTRSNPIFGPGHSNTGSLPVEDASVIISDGSNAVTIPYDISNEHYEIPASAFPIIAGQTYGLTVSTPKGENVSGSCTVPPSNPVLLTVNFTDTSSYNKKITVKWQDISGEVNYYRVVGQMVSIDPATPGDTSFTYMYIASSLYNDHDKDGNEMYAKLEGYWDGNSGSQLIAYDFYLLNIDPEYYTYQNSIDHYTYGDPFSEPSLIYTNIKGGLGVFAAYQILRVRIP